MGGRTTFWAILAMLLLAGVDLLGAYLAKEFSIRPRWFVLVAGAASFVVLFAVYVKSLSVSEMWIVTFGWVVLLEVGVLVLDRVHFGTDISPRKWVLAGLLVCLQVAIMLPDGADEKATAPAGALVSESHRTQDNVPEQPVVTGA